MRKRDENHLECHLLSLCLLTSLTVLYNSRVCVATLSVQCSATDNTTGECLSDSKSCSGLATCEATNSVQHNKYLDENEALGECKKRFSSSPPAYESHESSISATFIPYPPDPYFFQLDLDWATWHNAQGYHVSIEVIAHEDEDNPPENNYFFKCIEGKESSNTTILMEYSFALSYSSCKKDRKFQVKVIALPYLSQSNNVRYITEKWPNNCFDIRDDENSCGPRTPRDMHVAVETKPIFSDPSQMSVVLSWTNPFNTIKNITSFNIITYPNIPVLHLTTFHYSSTTGGNHSVILSPLNKSLEYTIEITPIQPSVCQYECFEVSAARRTCGPAKTTTVFYLPPAPLSLVSPSPSIALSVPTITSQYDFPSSTPTFRLSTSSFISTPSFSSTILTSITPPISAQISIHDLAKYLGISVAGILVLLLVFFMILIAVIVKRRYFPPSSFIAEGGEEIMKSSDESSIATTRSPTPASPSPIMMPNGITQFDYPLESAGHFEEPIIVIPSYYQEPLPSLLPDGEKLVLIVESLRVDDKDREAALYFLGCELGKYPGLRVLHYNPSSRKPASRWLLDYMTGADVVLCVCTKEFHEEWSHSHEHSLVHPLRDYIVGLGSRGESLSDKYLTITKYKEDKKYIPVELQSVRHCFIDETEEIYHIITRTPRNVVLPSQ